MVEIPVGSFSRNFNNPHLFSVEMSSSRSWSCTKHLICSSLAMAPQYIFSSHLGKCQSETEYGLTNFPFLKAKVGGGFTSGSDALDPAALLVVLPITRR